MSTRARFSPRSRLAGQALADHLRKVSANYEELIKEAGLYKSEKK